MPLDSQMERYLTISWAIFLIASCSLYIFMVLLSSISIKISAIDTIILQCKLKKA